MDGDKKYRYGVNEIIPSSQIVNIATSASAVLQKSDGLYRGDALTISKKNKGVKVSSNLTLKTETEDTCGDDFFSTHFENKRNENQISSRYEEFFFCDFYCQLFVYL